MKKPVRGINDNKILTIHQKGVLRQFSSSDLREVFRLTGGTALSAFYLEHRLSEDLDFFSSEKVPLFSIEQFLKTLPDVGEIVHTKLFDRQLFSLKFNDDTLLKVEFTFYPLKNVQEAALIENLPIDGYLDIIINKLCAIADRFEAKDYVDVYTAVKIDSLSLKELIKLAEAKCEVRGINHILKNRLLQIPDGIDRLPLKIALTRDDIESFFNKQIRAIVREEMV